MIKSKWDIYGIVLCECGGVVISNTGKVIYNMENNEVKCWNCGAVYNADYAFGKRRKNKTIILKVEDF